MSGWFWWCFFFGVNLSPCGGGGLLAFFSRFPGEWWKTKYDKGSTTWWWWWWWWWWLHGYIPFVSVLTSKSISQSKREHYVPEAWRYTSSLLVGGWLKMLHMVFICLSVWFFVSLFVCLFVCSFVCLFVCLYLCLHLCLFACLFACLFVCLLFCLFVCLYLRLFACILACLFVFVFCLLLWSTCRCVFLHLYHLSSSIYMFSIQSLILQSISRSRLCIIIPVNLLTRPPSLWKVGLARTASFPFGPCRVDSLLNLGDDCI